MANKYVYMLGIEPEYWTEEDENACVMYKVEHHGYYELGDNEGQILSGTLPDIKKLLRNYFGVDIIEEYLTEEDYFDWEDGEWLESKKSSKKSLKESSKYDHTDSITYGDFKCSPFYIDGKLNLKIYLKHDYVINDITSFIKDISNLKDDCEMFYDCNFDYNITQGNGWAVSISFVESK